MAKRPRLGVGAIGLHGSLRRVGGLTRRLGLVNGATYEGARLMLMATVLPLIFLIGLAKAATLTGKADIVDGDTIKIGGVPVRLYGIDAPEGRQTCQRDGKIAQLAAMIAAVKNICRECEPVRRQLAQCTKGKP